MPAGYSLRSGTRTSAVAFSRIVSLGWFNVNLIRKLNNDLDIFHAMNIHNLLTHLNVLKLIDTHSGNNPSTGAFNIVKGGQPGFAGCSALRQIWRWAAISSNWDFASKPFSQEFAERLNWLFTTVYRSAHYRRLIDSPLDQAQQSHLQLQLVHPLWHRA